MIPRKKPIYLFLETLCTLHHIAHYSRPDSLPVKIIQKLLHIFRNPHPCSSLPEYPLHLIPWHPKFYFQILIQIPIKRNSRKLPLRLPSLFLPKKPFHILRQFIRKLLKLLRRNPPRIFHRHTQHSPIPPDRIIIPLIRQSLPIIKNHHFRHHSHPISLLYSSISTQPLTPIILPPTYNTQLSPLFIFYSFIFYSFIFYYFPL